ncbi:MAG: hypothetical protein IJM20_06555 [Clostridia bacterium]|nr:hypothetical protein [Clostridia bacterium]
MIPGTEYNTFRNLQKEKHIDKKALIDSYVHEAHEKGVFTGTWLYAENGEIVSKGAVGFRDPEDRLPMQEDSFFRIDEVLMRDSELYVKACLKGNCYEERLYPLEQNLFTFKIKTDKILFEDGALIPWEETQKKL